MGDIVFYTGVRATDLTPLPCNGSDRDQAVETLEKLGSCTVLIDSTVEVCGLRFFGSPWVRQYAPWKTGFNLGLEDLSAHWKACATEVCSADVFLTHSPPQGTGDLEPKGTRKGCDGLLRLVD